MTEVRIRLAEPADAQAIHDLVVGLAVYEKEPDAVEGGPEDFAAALFCDSPQVFCHVAEVRDSAADNVGDHSAESDKGDGGDGDDESGDWEVAGIAIWYVTFSTWKVRHGVWLEDLFVTPERRGLGLGRMLLETLAQVCVERGYPRFEWWVLDWNTPAHGFYRSLGAVPQDEWTVWRTDGEALATLGRR